MARNSELTDEALVTILMHNARIPFTEIARMYNVNEATIRKRVKKLEDSGIIRGYTARVDPRLLGFKVDALIGLDTEPDYYISTIKWLKRRKDIRRLWTSSGDHMIMFRIWFKGNAELSAFVSMLEKKEGVTKVCPAILIEELK